MDTSLWRQLRRYSTKQERGSYREIKKPHNREFKNKYILYLVLTFSRLYLYSYGT